MERLRVVFMGTPDFAVPSLEALHGFAEVVGVFTQPDRPVGRGRGIRFSPVKEKALELGLHVFQPLKVSVGEGYDQLVSCKPDIIVVVAYGQLLKQNVLSLPRLGCVNVHASLLPRWRGAAPIQRAILAGDELTGVTTMAMALELDAGDIYLKEEVPISENDGAQEIHDRLAAAGARLLRPTLEGLAAGTLTSIPQKADQVTYAHKLTKEMEWLDPRNDAAYLDRQIRALNPWPGTSLKLADGTRIKVRKARLGTLKNYRTHQLLEDRGHLFLGTAAGVLELLEVQWEGKRPVDGAGFVNAVKGRGDRFPVSVAEGELTGDGQESSSRK